MTTPCGYSAILMMLIILGALPVNAEPKPAGQGEVVASSGKTVGKYHVFPYSESPVYRFPYRIEIDLQDGRKWHALPRFQSQHTDFDEPFAKAPVEMTLDDGGRLLVFSEFVDLPNEVMDVMYFAPGGDPFFKPGTPMYLVSVKSLGRTRAEEGWYTITGLRPDRMPRRLQLQNGPNGITGRVLDEASRETGHLRAISHGSVLIGTLGASRSPMGARFRWVFEDGGRRFTGVWWSDDDPTFVAGEKIKSVKVRDKK